MISFDPYNLSSDSHPLNSGSHPYRSSTPTQQPNLCGKVLKTTSERKGSPPSFLWMTLGPKPKDSAQKNIPSERHIYPHCPAKSSINIIHLSSIYDSIIQFNILYTVHIISPHPWMVAMKKHTFLDFLVPINLPRVSGAEQPAENSADSSGWDAGALSAAMKMDRYQLGFQWLLIHFESPKLPLFLIVFDDAESPKWAIAIFLQWTWYTQSQNQRFGLVCSYVAIYVAMKIRSMQSIPDSGTCPKTAKHRAEAHGATNRTGTCGSGMCWGTSGCSKKLLYSCSKRGVRHDFFLENQRLLQRVKACQNTSKHVMLQHQLQNSESNIPTYSNPLAAKWNSSMNPQSFPWLWCVTASPVLKIWNFIGFT